MRIKKMRENSILPKCINGNWADCYVSQIGTLSPKDETGAVDFNDTIWYDENKHKTIYFAKGDIVIIKLGFALELPKGHELHLLPRSSTFKHTGLLLTNSMGIGDDSYIGDNDEYRAMFYATRDGEISIGDRVVQMRVEKSMGDLYTFEEVEHFGNDDRGGYGTSGK